jgi:hypothetical protein
MADPETAGAAETDIYGLIHDHLLRGLQKQFDALKPVPEFKDEELEWIYSVACGIYSQAKYPVCLNLLILLVTCRPLEPRYLKALATVYQVDQQFDAAIKAYDQLLLMTADDSEAIERRAQCLSRVSGTAS